MAARKRFNYSFSPSFNEAVQDIAYNGLLGVQGEDGKRSASMFLEKYFTYTVILPDLKKRKINPAKLNAALNDTDKICEIWTAIRAAERNEPGYKIHSHPKAGIIAIEIPDPNNPGSKLLL